PRPAAGAPAAAADHASVPDPSRRRGVQPRRPPPRGDHPGGPHLRRRRPVTTLGGPRILFSRPDHVGDVLLTLPAVPAPPRARAPGPPWAHPGRGCPLPPAGAAPPRPAPAGEDPHSPPSPPLTVLPGAGGWSTAAREVAVGLRGRFDAAILPRPDDPWSGPL